MSDLDKVLDQLVAGEEDKAKETFHNMVVQQSRDEWNKLQPQEAPQDQPVQEAVNKSALKAWYDKYSKYEGNNGDPLPKGMFLGHIDTGILTDGVETNEFADAVEKLGGDRDEAENKLFSDEQLFSKLLPITDAMQNDYMKAMGVSEIDEDNCTQAAKILGDDVVGFGVESMDMNDNYASHLDNIVATSKHEQGPVQEGTNDNPYDHNEGEDVTALVNSALWNMKDMLKTIEAGQDVEEDDMFAYGDLVQYLEQADMPDHYSKFWDLVTDAVNSAGGFKGQGFETWLSENPM